MRKLLLILWSVAAWSATTTVQQAIIGPDGQPASGTVNIRITAPCVSVTDYVGAKTISRTFTGTLSVKLVPNDSCTPANTSYTVGWTFSDGRTLNQTWVVPTSGSAVSVDSVVFATPPVPSLAIPQSQVTGLISALAGKESTLSFSSPLSRIGNTVSCPTCGSGAVSSVFGRTGAIVKQSGDYAVGDLTAGALPAGSTFAMPQWVEYLAGVCQGSLASISWSLPSSNAPTALCKTGTNTNLGVAQFTATGQSVQGSLILPDDWTSLLTLEYRFLSESAASTGNVVWAFQYACSATAGSIDPSLSAAQTATVAAGANNAVNIATLTPTISGCSAGNRLWYKLTLDASTTASGSEDLIGIRFKVKRTVTAL